MRIQSIRIKNYRSFLDSGPISFAPGFNLIVGANNVGKSSLLHCLAGKLSGEPHRSIYVLPDRDNPLNRLSQVDYVVIASGEETRRLLINSLNGQRYFPWPEDAQFQGQSIEAVFSRIVTAEVVPFQVTAQATDGAGGVTGWTISEYPATRLYSPQGEGNMLSFVVDTALGDIHTRGVATGVSAENDAGFALAPLIINRTYEFHAERMTLGVGPYGTNTELRSDAQNLPEVLNILQANPQRFVDYCNFVREIFPSIQTISVRPHPNGGNQLEIMVWQVDPHFKRDDLAIPLNKCGSGVGQVLALLYVANISERPRTIIIDEPGSFLHPGAARALMGILKRFGQHQYIIATHSPEIISELADAPVTIIRWFDSKSVIEQPAGDTRATSAAALTEVGARLSDVFGFDKVLWVEGQSDADTLRLLLEAIGRPQRRVGILPVRDTGSFRRRKIAEVIDIYRRLSLGAALLPPAVLFLFDRDGRTERDIADAIRESRGMIRFLKRRMLENYLIEPTAVATLFNQEGDSHGITTTSDNVHGWISSNSPKYLETQDPLDPFSTLWYEQVDGAGILGGLFEELSGAKLEYRKTSHTPRLAILLLKSNREAAQRIVELVSSVVE